MAEHYTPIQKVLKYYPQRVQVLLMALLNLAFIIFPADAAIVGGVNAVVLALLVFFYGEPRTASKAAVADWLEAENEEIDGIYELPPDPAAG